jgi:dihydrodipicolinate synthase/N-acetylneuraminate lyase
MKKQGLAREDAMFQVQGIVPVVPTPLKENPLVDWQGLRALTDFAYSSGAYASCLPAYTGEFYKLSEDERSAAPQRKRWNNRAKESQ